MDALREPVVSINEITIDLVSEQMRGASGELLALRPQSFAVLRYLLSRPNRLVEKEELIEALWPGLAVTDDSLVQCIHEIRRALRDDRHLHLKTVPKRGYRIVLQGGQPPPETSKPSRRKQFAALVATIPAALMIAAGLWWFAADSVKAPLPAPQGPTIAVLPFRDLSRPAPDSYFADGLSEDIIAALAKLPDVRVIARNSSWEFGKEPVDPQAIASKLGVRYLVRGSVERSRGRIRIVSHLVDTKDSREVWADHYDRPEGDVFAIRDGVVRHIASALALKLASPEAPETTNLEAYDTLLQGLDLLHRETEEDTLQAQILFKRSIELDRSYSRAYAALAAANLRIVVSSWITNAGAGCQVAYHNLHINLAKALEKPTALAYAVQSRLLAQQGRYSEADTAIDQALAMAPNDSSLRVDKAKILNATGQATEAEVWLKAAAQLDPRFSANILHNLAIAEFNQGRYQDAVDTLNRILAQDVALAEDYMLLTSAFGHLGRASEAKLSMSKYDKAAVKGGLDPLTIQENNWFWNGDSFNYYPAYISSLTEGLHKAGVPEGAGNDIPFAIYRKRIVRHEGEFDVVGATSIDATKAKALHDRGVLFIDVGSHANFAMGHIPRSKNLSVVVDLSQQALAPLAAKDDEIVVYCAGVYCPYSAYAAAKLVTWGYTHIYRYSGGLPDWQLAGNPVSREKLE